MAVYMGIWIDGTNKPASDAAIASVFVYAVGWSIGLCTVQYLYGTEIYPTRIRSVCYATNMALHWFFPGPWWWMGWRASVDLEGSETKPFGRGSSSGKDSSGRESEKGPFAHERKTDV
uniref:MFS quinate transporter n=1 Tax=Colletotrichum fructicola (strain Nara gc5) TaxID=1213859 RepID=L2FI89_COLFN